METSGPRSLAEFPRISLRKFSAAGPILRDARLTPAYLLLEAEELVLLIHGYNNSETVAFNSYRAFMGNLESKWASCSSGVFWPGDGLAHDESAVMGRRSLFLSTISYPLQPQRAEEAAKYLAEILANALLARSERANRNGRAPAALVINIVAHSMGCRLTLELLKLLRFAVCTGAPLKIRNVALMAAAVPRYDVETRGLFDLALETPDKIKVYWSRTDAVLRFTFPLGQFLTRPFPLGWNLSKRSALGRWGISDRDKLTNVEVSLGHSDYWSDKFIASQTSDDLDG